MKKKKTRRFEIVPVEPCAYCNRPLESSGWVVNGRGDLLHYPDCFLGMWKLESARALNTNVVNPR